MPSGGQNRTHGQSGIRRTKLYGTWLSLRNRCNNPNNPSYPYYGGRGIKVCARWDRYENFAADMGEPPTPQHTIERRDNDGDYEPTNCYWATRLAQSRNRAYCKLNGLHGDIKRLYKAGMTQQQIADHYGVSQVRISQITRGA